jgi:hypothetical protein
VVGKWSFYNTYATDYFLVEEPNTLSRTSLNKPKNDCQVNIIYLIIKKHMWVNNEKLYDKFAIEFFVTCVMYSRIWLQVFALKISKNEYEFFKTAKCMIRKKIINKKYLWKSFLFSLVFCIFLITLILFKIFGWY